VIKPTIHRTRQRGGHAVGTVIGSSARIAHAAAAMLTNATAAAAPTQPRGRGLSTTVGASGFTVKLISGRSVAFPSPAAGWARHSRLPVTTATSAMYQFAAWAAGVKSQGKQLKNKEALLEMRRAGTAAFTTEWPNDPYVAGIRTATGAAYFSRMHLFEHAALKALLTKGAAYCKAQAAKALAREQKAVTAAQKAVTAAAKKRMQQPLTAAGGGAAGGAAAPPAKRPRAYDSGHLVDASAVTALDSRLDALPSKAVHGIGVDMLLHYAKPQGWPTCAALAAMVGNVPAIEARPPASPFPPPRPARHTRRTPRGKHSASTVLACAAVLNPNPNQARLGALKAQLKSECAAGAKPPRLLGAVILGRLAACLARLKVLGGEGEAGGGEAGGGGGGGGWGDGRARGGRRGGGRGRGGRWRGGRWRGGRRRGRRGGGQRRRPGCHC